MTFATWDSAQLSSVTLDGTQLVATASGGGNVSARGQGTHGTGKWYWEITLTTAANNNTAVAVVPAQWAPGSSATARLIRSGNVLVNGTTALTLSGTSANSITFTALSSGNVVGVALDLDAGLLWFRVGAGNWNNNAGYSPVTGIGGISLAVLGAGPAINWYPVAAFGAVGDQQTANFGASAFTGTPPSGFTSGWTTAAAVTNALATRAGYEAWVVGTPGMQVTRIGYEAWFSIIPAAVVTRIGREVWFDASATASTARPKRRFMVIAG